MTFPLSNMTLRVLSTLACATTLVACGGGGGGTANTDSVQAGLVVSKGSTATGVLTPFTPVAPVTPTTPSVPTPDPVPTPTASGTLAVITDVRFQNTGTSAQTAVPVTFGQVFAVGNVKPTDVMVGRLEDSSLVALQMDVKATHADGSVRHAVFSTIVPALAASTTRVMSLAKNASPVAVKTTLPAELIAAGFTASASTTIGGVKYSASADQLLKAGAKATWLSGNIVNEWHVSAPLTTAAGVAHPHLSARFAVRYYSSIKKARVDVTIENDWAYEPNPQNFKYNAEVVVGGKSVFAKNDLTHLHHARWRKIFWWGGDAPQVNPMLNTQYLIASRAVPNYDQSITIAPATLQTLSSIFAGASPEPMNIGMAAGYMPMTGAHEDIGILPSWASAYVLSMDARAREATLGTADSSGTWSVHYRDRKTDRPVSLSNYPYMTIDGRWTDTFNPTTNSYESFPAFAADSPSPFTADTAHQPSLAYVPYLVTGDYYYLEEIQYWAMWNLLKANPGYRQYDKGLLLSEQVRGQAWGLRTLADAAYITPDADVLKKDFVSFLNNNLDWYNAEYSNNANANKLGAIINGFAISYGNTALAPWQDDFFTSAVGHTAELGFTKAASLLAWKSKFPVQRMMTPGACWLFAAPYYLSVRDTETSPLYDSIARSYVADHGAAVANLPCNSPAMASVLGLIVGDMGNISSGNMGYPSNMQPALAYAADSGIPSSKAAWTLFMSRTVKPDYSVGPQFAIVPR